MPHMPRLRKLPEAQAMTSRALAAELGVAESTISRIRHGKRLPGRDRFYQMCEYLNIPWQGCGAEAWDDSTEQNCEPIRALLEQVIPL